jgi:hypothetical protein
MSLGEYHRAVGQFLACGILIAGLVAARLLGLRFDQWPPAAQLVSMAMIVVVTMVLTLRIARSSRR